MAPHVLDVFALVLTRSRDLPGVEGSVLPSGCLASLLGRLTSTVRTGSPTPAVRAILAC